MSAPAPHAQVRSLRTGFERHARSSPTATALVVNGRSLSYAEVDRKARIWAGAIVNVSRNQPQRVGVFGSRSEVAYVGVLAALYSGSAFVPLNPTFPAHRTRTMIEQADLDAIIVDGAAARQVASVIENLDRCPPMLFPSADTPELPRGITALGRNDIEGLEPLGLLPEVTPDRVAYLLFTSGSTGIPKGVPVTHANVLHFLDFATARYGITANDRFSQTFDQTFDLSVFDLFVAWENGACVCAMQPLDLLAPARFVVKHGVTVWFSVPSIAALMRKKNLLKPNVFPTLRWSLFCGEPLPRASAEAWAMAAPDSTVENLYGPTELTIACLVHRWDPKRSPESCVNDVVPIGVPFDGLTAVVLDPDLRAVAAGEAGELCVSGPQTVPGYWNAPAKTAEQFVTIELPDGRRERFYRTGDRVRRLPGGEYVYLGRTDHQIKVMGHRVELSEVEAALARNPGVSHAVAVGWPVKDGSAEGLVAFVSGIDVDPARITANLRQVLPDYMTPRRVIVLDALPLNANGKVDRNALRHGLDADRYTAHSHAVAEPS